MPLNAPQLSHLLQRQCTWASVAKSWRLPQLLHFLYGSYFDFGFSGNEFTLAESVNMKTDTNGEEMSFAVFPDSWSTRLQTTIYGVELTN